MRASNSIKQSQSSKSPGQNKLRLVQGTIREGRKEGRLVSMLCEYDWLRLNSSYISNTVRF